MGKQKTILVVDDSESIREVLTFELERNGFIVIKATDGVDAFEKCNLNNIDLLLTDLHMPNMNGLELIRKVRLIEKYRHLPILFLTTETQQTLLLEAKRSGATGWITKPFNAGQLIKTIQKVIR